MKIRNINRVITTKGTTSDIIRTVMYAYDVERDPQINELAEKLRGETVEQTCRNIWQYLVDNITYRADADGTKGEMIRTPARLVHDGTGDCKSYSLFTAVVLRYLGIPHVFRFASYNTRKEATHVYVVALPNSPLEVGGNIIIDAVATVQLNKNFNEEVEYTYKCDMANGTTKISYLAGFNPANRIGAIETDVNSDERYAVWIGSRSELETTPGHAYLFARYDLLTELVNISPSDRETAELYNQLAVIAALLWAYDYTDGVTSDFDDMALIISGLKAEGLFITPETDEDVRDDWFRNIITEIEYRYINNLRPKTIDVQLYNSIIENVLNYNTLPDTDSISGLSGFTPIADALKKAGIYFIYLFIPDSELKNYPAIVAKKRKTQQFFYELIHKVDIFHNAATVKDFFRSGIIARTGMTPENYIKSLKQSNVKVAALSATLITISAIIGIILGLVELIKVIFPSSKIGDYSVSSGAADMQNEIYSTNKSGSGNTTLSSLTSGSGLWLGLGLVASLFVIKNKN